MGRVFGSVVKWAVALALFGGLLGLAYAANAWARRQRAAEEGEAVSLPRRAENGVVKLGAELAASHGIQDEPARAVLWYPPLVVYGRVVPNPQATAEVRSPFAGTLRADPNAPWPTPGRRVEAGQVVGRVDIRVGPQERLDFQAKLNDARLKQQGAEDVLKVQQGRVGRLQKATAAESVSRRELDEALVALTEARTQAATAAAAVTLWQQALRAVERGGDRPAATWGEPLTVPAAGEVTELAARPDMAVEAGGLVARVVDFRRVLVRLDLPPEALTPGPPEQVELDGTPPVPATLAGAAPQVDAASQLAGYWYEAHTDGGAACRPGRFVKAVLRVGSKPQEAVTVARGAVLCHQGRHLVYVRLNPGRFERREVQVLGQDGDRWVLAAGVTAGEAVVTRQAQVLLSEEFRGEVDND
jgi:HlyD family secretion protein